MGFEPTTASLEGWNSTTELRPQYPLKSLDPLLYKLTLFTITHSQISNDAILNEYTICFQSTRVGGQARVRTLEADGSRFTVCPR